MFVHLLVPSFTNLNVQVFACAIIRLQGFPCNTLKSSIIPTESPAYLAILNITTNLLRIEKFWVAPEHLRNPRLPLSQSGDVYSYGIILQEILLRDLPYSTYEFLAPRGKTSCLMSVIKTINSINLKSFSSLNFYIIQCDQLNRYFVLQNF